MERRYNFNIECVKFDTFFIYKRVDVEDIIGFVSMEFRKLFELEI